jgi:translocator protein
VTRNRYAFPALNSVGLALMLTLNALANALPINGVTTGAVSDRYDNLFVPASLTFAIWGLIYLLLTAFVIYEWVAARKDDNAFSSRIGIWFFISCVANAGWILAWHYEMLPLTLLIMLVLLGCLLAIYVRLGIGIRQARRSELLLVHVPFSVYLGWVTVATIANVAALLVSIGWGGWGLSPQLWTTAVIAVGTGIALAMAMRRRDIYFCLVFDWALLGILMKRLADTVTPDGAVVAAVIVGIVLVSAAIIIQAARRNLYTAAVAWKP